ncbi:VOC family protein [Nocardia sp. NPDC005998]|uniref:VOC family protein n=1 Tax=Nocardia sp. NPDC005998 TaxID=3156894 RepID=UPI0033A4BE68
MKANINAITLAVRDLERSLHFYRDGLGLSSPGIIGTEFVRDEQYPGGSVAMFTLDNGLILSLYARTDLALDAGIPPERVTGSPISLGLFLDSREDVDLILHQAEQAGGHHRPPTPDPPLGHLRGLLRRPGRPPVGSGPFPEQHTRLTYARSPSTNQSSV